MLHRDLLDSNVRAINICSQKWNDRKGLKKMTSPCIIAFNISDPARDHISKENRTLRGHSRATNKEFNVNQAEFLGFNLIR